MTSGFLLWAASGFDDTDPLAVRPERFGGDRTDRAPAARPARLRVVSWNIAYGRGRKDDAGDLRSETTVRANLAGIAGVLRDLRADVVALQEVDFDSARTHGIDQLAYLAREAGYPWAARVETWACRYVPYPYWPPAQHYGRMRSGQAVLSRFPIRSNVRHLLPQPPNPFWYNWFYLHRALQHVELELGGGTSLDVLNVHTEAFHQGNREDHADRIAARVRGLPDRPRLLLGDFNAVPPEATLRRAFPDEPETDMTTDRTVAAIRALGLAEALDLDAPLPDTFTFPADVPNRRLDYVWFSPSFRRVEGRVVREAGSLSDHLPVVVELAF
ncbi:MAG: endonuclease/exonuclease/phosphatase family protein [Deltaproteobacteria bacterium]|nr:endonuclease/exonuclease/phosphatase family protein [Deltaproteobacteria bacterium]